MSLSDTALRAAVLKTLLDDITEQLTADKNGMRAAMRDGGIERVSARLPDGTKVASMPLVGGENSPRVTDERAFSRWVAENHPGETETVIRDSYRKSVLDAAKKAGRAVDRQTGDVIPGITFEPTTPYVKVDFAKDDLGGREHIRRAWRDGTVSLPEMLALPGPAPVPAPAAEEPVIARESEPAGDFYFNDDGFFRSPEHAAAHAIDVQGGFSTPEREARRMLRDARSAMLRCCEHCPGTCPSMIACSACGWSPRWTDLWHYEFAAASPVGEHASVSASDPRPPHPGPCGECGARDQGAYDHAAMVTAWLEARGLSPDGEGESPGGAP